MSLVCQTIKSSLDVRSEDIFLSKCREGTKTVPRETVLTCMCPLLHCSDSTLCPSTCFAQLYVFALSRHAADATTSDKLAVVLSAVFAGAGGALGWMSLRPNMLCSPCVTHLTSFIYGHAAFCRPTPQTVVRNSDSRERQ